MMLRILHVISQLDPSDGGPPMALSRLAGTQAHFGAQVTIAALEPTMKLDDILSAYRPVTGFDKIAIEYLARGTVLERLLARQAGARLTFLADNHDLIHIHGIWRPHLLEATRIARRAGRPYVISPHGMLSNWSLTQKNFKKQVALSVGWRTALEQAAFLHVLNQDEGVAVTTVCTPRKLVMLPNGVSLDELSGQTDTEAVWNRFPQLRGIPYIAFVGRLHHSKGLDILANAFAQVARAIEGIQLVVMGPEFGDGDAFNAKIRRLGVQSRVHVLGGIYGADKIVLLKHATCFCLPSRQEGFSMAIIEAMAIGLPVVVSDACHFPEIASEGAGQVVKLDADAFAQAILRLLTDDAFRTQQGTKARHLAHSRYQWSSIAQSFIQAYLRTCNSALIEDAACSA
jgi:glycosyltransferase involved in cell wall biosynthesis